MSALNNLFGSAGPKTVSAVAALFAKPNNVDELQVKNKSRTLIARPAVAAPVPETETVDDVEEEPARKKKKSKQNDENDELEVQYYSKVLGEDSEQKPQVDEESDSEDEEHVDSATKNVQGEEAKVVNLKEAELAKAERTIFVGNVPNEVITSKKLYKEFKKLLTTDPRSEEQIQGSAVKSVATDFQVESIRFRSIAFEEALPRKVAFVQQKLHKARDSINAYAVYKNTKPVRVMTEHLNGFVFHDHHLRVDSVTHPASHDKNRSVFVGNLDFEEVEESLWKHFEPCGEIEYVRIIRDAKSNVGKGFAYVQFKDFQSVNKALMLHEKKIHQGKKARKLRVSRCKNMKKSQNLRAGAPHHQRTTLNEQQKTKLGRAKKALGRADRAKLGEELTIEGLRATKGETTPVLKRTKKRSKTGRVTKRSIAFKKQNGN